MTSRELTFKALQRYLKANEESAEHELGRSRMAQPTPLAKMPQPAQGKTLVVPPSAGHPVKKILVAVDRKDHPAIKSALDLAERFQGVVAIIYVLDPQVGISSQDGFVLVETISEQRKKAQQTLDEIEDVLPPNTLAFTSLREGNVADEIIGAARDFGADFIVLGAHRRGPVARFLHRNIWRPVLRHTQCPIVLVPDPARSAVGKTQDG